MIASSRHVSFGLRQPAAAVQGADHEAAWRKLRRYPAAIQPLVSHVRDSDPGTAFSWAASISDENDRLNELRQTLQTWRGSDLQAARAALAAAELTAKERKSLGKELE